MNRYEWIPTECAPEKYPTQILKADLICSNGETFYIPDKRMVFNGWGKEGSIHMVGEELKPIPKTLYIKWFSFTENKFFEGTFELPQSKIEQLFKEGYTSPLTGTYTTYKNILVGMAPGGVISVWLLGEQATKEVSFFQAKSINSEWKEFVANASYPREKYIQLKLEQIFKPADFESLKKNGIPLGLYDNKYHIAYAWRPEVIAKASPDDIQITTFNAERENFDYKTGEKIANTRRTVPQKIVLRYTVENAKHLAEITFDEEEIFAAFAKLNSEKLLAPLRLQIQISNNGQALTIALANEKHILELKSCKLRATTN